MSFENIPVVILCGGFGTRMKEETEFRPKPMVTVGNMPMLWHIMKIYSHYGFKNFILCLGYKSDMIKDWFVNFDWKSHDFSLDLASSGEKKFHTNHHLEDWNITFAETGQDTNTGGRIKKIQKYINADNFFVTYGDGVADVNIRDLLEFHLKNNKIATLTAIQPPSKFGVIEHTNNLVTSFKEKPKLDGWINGGFFVFTKKIFDYLSENDVLEKEPLVNLSKDSQLLAYTHTGFWECMDTFKDVQRLNQLWESGKAFWKVWE